MSAACSPCRRDLVIKLLVAVTFAILFFLRIPKSNIFRSRQLHQSFSTYKIKDGIKQFGTNSSHSVKEGSAAKPERLYRARTRSRSTSALALGHFSAVFSNASASHVTYTSLAEMVDRVTRSGYRFANYSSGVKEEAIERFQASLPPLLENYRSPCWLEYLGSEHVYDNSYYLLKDCMERDAVRKSFSWTYVTYKQRLAKDLHWRVRCMPGFYLLGMPKSGTTDLYVAMIRYMKYVISGARKESHFWNRRRFGITYSGSCHNAPDNGAATLKDYLDLHDEAAEKTKMRYQQKGNKYYHKMLIGDFTPSTMWSLPRWWRIHGNQNLEEPLYTSAHHLYGVWPQSKFIVMLRDPVERAFSQMKYRSLPRDGQVAAHFHDLVVNTIQELEVCRPLRGCIYNRTDPQSPDMDGNFIIIPGMYALFINDWWKVFPREQFHFIRFENYKRNKTRELDGVLKFLDTDPLDPKLRVTIDKLPVANKGIETETMWNRTRKILEDFYRPWNSLLAEILGDNMYRWNY